MEYKIHARVSNRHVHLTKETYEKLFDEEMTKKFDLNQIGEYATNQLLTIRVLDEKIENVRVLGPFRNYDQIEISKKDARRLDDFLSFDQILLDSPCSGSGTINIENENLDKYFTITLIQKCIKSQTELLKKAIKLLKPGKEMVYSTCSILKEENEEIVEKILKENKTEIVPISLEGMEEIPTLPTSIEGTLCICPNEYYEGFYVAKIRKISN